MALVAVGLTLFTNLRTETSTINLWLWMIVTGVGVGPMMAVFTLIVQNAVPFRLLGTATSDLTLFRQIGTSVGLTVAFTVFQNNLTWGLLRDQIIAKGAPAASVPPVAPAVPDDIEPQASPSSGSQAQAKPSGTGSHRVFPTVAVTLSGRATAFPRSSVS